MQIDPKEFLNSRRFSILFSGGKDSLAALLWTLDNIQHEDFNIIYVEVTGNTHPECNNYVHRIAKELGVHHKLRHLKREDIDFFTALKRWGIPITGKYRWCLYQFKVKVWERASYNIQVVGIRKTDSSRRRKTQLVRVFRGWRQDKLVICPIATWTKRQVIEYIKQHDVELNPCYRRFGHSGNCMFCPNHTVEKIVLTLQEPEWRNKILDALLSQRGKNHYAVKAWLSRATQKTLTSFFQV